MVFCPESLPKKPMWGDQLKTSAMERSPKLRSVIFGIVATCIAGALLILTPISSAADTGGYPNWNTPCRHTGLSTGYCANYDWGSGWSPRGYGYRNCTDWVAWRLQSLGIPDSKTRGLGNAKDWPANAQARGIGVGVSPQVGDAAVRTSGSYGHVAFVESVSGSRITVSEYNNAGTGVYGVRSGTPSQLNFQKFVHFGASPTLEAPPPPPPPARIVIRQGGSLLAKDGIGDTWTKLVDGSSMSFAVAGNRIAYLDGSAGLNMKEGLGGPWVRVAGNVSDFRITDSRIIIRQGDTLSAKDGIGDTWTTLTNGSSSNYAIAGNRIAYLSNANDLLVKVGIGGVWTKVADNVSDFRITDSRIIIRQGDTLSAKDGIGDTWTTLTNGSSSNYAIAGNRIAYKDATGGLSVKEGIGGVWTKVADQVDDFSVGNRDAPFGTLSVADSSDAGGKGAPLKVGCQRETADACILKLHATAKFFFKKGKVRKVRLPARTVRVPARSTKRVSISLNKRLQQIRQKSVRVVINVRMTLADETQATQVKVVLLGGAKSRHRA